jgi:hypothetical protein
LPLCSKAHLRAFIVLAQLCAIWASLGDHVSGAAQCFARTLLCAAIHRCATERAAGAGADFSFDRSTGSLSSEDCVAGSAIVVDDDGDGDGVAAFDEP